MLFALTALCQQPKIASGKLVYFKFTQSKYIENREIAVWLPNNYNKSKKYNVLYMHDGASLFDTAVSWNHKSWDIDETMQQLTDENKISNTIVVGIYNAEWKRRSEFFPKKVFDQLPLLFQDSLRALTDNNKNSIFNGEIQSDNYLKFIVKELKPYIDSVYSTKKGPENTFIAGSSMGALISIYALCEYPLVFGGAACLSTHWNGTAFYVINEIPEAILSYISKNLPLANMHKIYFDYGSVGLDTLYAPYQIKIDTIMEQKKYTLQNWITKVFVGDGHDEVSWKNRIHFPLQFLLNH
jgi:predicted alpha/beta superfamily hydrolase